jgi:hypothetical protein
MDQQGTVLLKMLSTTVMLIDSVCRFQEVHPLMDRAALADFVEKQARTWHGDVEHAVVVQVFVEALRERGEPQLRNLLQ